MVKAENTALSTAVSYARDLPDAASTLVEGASSAEEGGIAPLFPAQEPIVLVAIRPKHPEQIGDTADAVALLAFGGTVGKLVSIKDIFAGIMTLDKADELLCSARAVAIEQDFSLTRSFPFRHSAYVESQLEMLLYWIDCYADETGRSGLIFEFLVSKSRGQGLAPRYFHPAIQAIDEHDAKYETEWRKTLFSFLKHDSRAQRCAEELYLHRNAVLYRLKRMKEYTGIDLDDPYERAYLRMSLIPW